MSSKGIKKLSTQLTLLWIAITIILAVSIVVIQGCIPLVQIRVQQRCITDVGSNTADGYTVDERDTHTSDDALKLMPLK